MKNIQKTALVSLFVAAASGYAVAQTNLSDANLSGINSISTTMEVDWNSQNPMVDKKYSESESNREKRESYRNSQRVLARKVANAGIDLDEMVAVNFAAMLENNNAINSLLAPAADADAHFKVTVYQWGLLSNNGVQGDNVKPVIALRVDLIDRSGDSVWHDFQRISESSPATNAYRSSQLYGDSDRLAMAFDQAIIEAVDRVGSSL